MTVNNIYEQGLDKNPANFAHLTTLSFIERSASVYPDKTSIIHGDTRYTWKQTYERCCLLASALIKHGIGKGDTVSFMGATTPETFEAHFAVPMTGAVLNAQTEAVASYVYDYIGQNPETGEMGRCYFKCAEYSLRCKSHCLYPGSC